MLRNVFVALACVVALGNASARAHFIWLDLQPTSGEKAQARLYFSEEPQPGEPELIAKAAGVKVWLRSADGPATELKLAPAGEDDAALVAECAGAASSLEGDWNYGVYSRGGKSGPLLLYYAKALSDDWTKHPRLARAEKLKFDIVPTLEGGKLSVLVLFDGQPLADGELQFIDPQGEHHDLTTDAAGKAQIDAKPGQWGVRANKLETDKGGEQDGKKYDQTWHYATAMFDLPGPRLTAEKAPAKPADPSALALLERSREGRSIWYEFPGFTCDLTVLADDQEIKGKATIDSDGVVTLEMPQSKVSDWVEEQLNSMVQHRMPDGEVSQGDVTFAEEQGHHPLGRKIDLGDPSAQSTYRIKDDVIMEVNRNAGPAMRFTISVLEIERNPENKYLPRSFTMNFFNSRSGDLTMSLGYFNSWQRVGGFDLPKQIIEVDAQKGSASTKEITFSNCQLIPKQ